MRHLIARPATTALLIGATATAITVGAPGAAGAATTTTATLTTGTLTTATLTTGTLTTGTLTTGTLITVAPATTATGGRAHGAPLPPSGQRKGRPVHGRKKRHQPPRSSFMLMRSKSGTARWRDEDKTTLYCEPAGGDHPKAADACRDLLASKGDFQRPAGDTVCPMVHAPVTVQAIGLWRGTVKRFSATYGNECIMRSRTGAVFGY